MAEAKRELLGTLIKEAKKQIRELVKKHEENKLVSGNKFRAEAASLVDSCNAIRSELSTAVKQGVTIQEYSGDPSYCANHCYSSCGYEDSIGDKICWYRCYRCCMNGGC
jgi:hypothetical protein